MLPATDKNLRSFGLVLAAALPLLAGFLLWKSGYEHRGLVAAVLGAAGLAFLLLGLLAPRLLVVLYRPWMLLAHYMGLVMTAVLMTVFYFVLLVPFTLVRLRDPLRLRLGAPSYWEPRRNAESTLERFRRPF